METNRRQSDPNAIPGMKQTGCGPAHIPTPEELELWDRDYDPGSLLNDAPVNHGHPINYREAKQAAFERAQMWDATHRKVFPPRPGEAAESVKGTVVFVVMVALALSFPKLGFPWWVILPSLAALYIGLGWVAYYWIHGCRPKDLNEIGEMGGGLFAVASAFWILAATTIL